MRPTHFVVLERRFLLVGLLLAAPFGAIAQEKTPRAFVEDIYRSYQTKGFKGQRYWESSRFFAPDLAAAIERDMAQAKQRKEVPVLDGDPFVDAQDWQISDLMIATSDGDGKPRPPSPSRISASQKRSRSCWFGRRRAGASPTS